MKKSAIILLLLVGVGVFVVMSSVQDASTYESFSIAAENPDRDYHVVGKLVLPEKMVFDPQTNPNYFEFWLQDNKGDVSKVILHQGKPVDFDRNSKAQIVVVGKMGDGAFEADQMLTKCPSKYEDEKKANLKK
jgi:cytochrome c-type biogenesis protein CcmE